MKIHWFYQSLPKRASGRNGRAGGTRAARGAEVKAVPLATKTTNGNPKRKASGKKYMHRHDHYARRPGPDASQMHAAWHGGQDRIQTDSIETDRIQKDRNQTERIQTDRIQTDRIQTDDRPDLDRSDPDRPDPDRP